MVLILGTLSAFLAKHQGVNELRPGQPVPVFAVPLASGDLSGEADIATHANDGPAGKVPACLERGLAILNICELYERAPVVLALFVDASSCTGSGTSAGQP